MWVILSPKTCLSQILLYWISGTRHTIWWLIGRISLVLHTRILVIISFCLVHACHCTALPIHSEYNTLWYDVCIVLNDHAAQKGNLNCFIRETRSSHFQKPHEDHDSIYRSRDKSYWSAIWSNSFDLLLAWSWRLFTDNNNILQMFFFSANTIHHVHNPPSGALYIPWPVKQQYCSWQFLQRWHTITVHSPEIASPSAHTYTNRIICERLVAIELFFRMKNDLSHVYVCILGYIHFCDRLRK